MSAEKHRVVMIIGLFYPFVGGAEKECQKLAMRLREQGTPVTVLTQYCEGLSEYEEIGELPVYRKMKGWHWFEITYMLSVLRFLIKHRKRYDIIQCFGLYLFIPSALVMKYLFRKKVIARLECSGRFGDFWRIKQLRWGKLVLACSKRCDTIIYISQDIREELIAHNYPREKLVHITNSVDSDQFKPDDRSDDKESKRICFVGRLEEQKGLEYLVKALDVVRKKEEAVKLLLVGDGQLRSYLETLSAELKLQKHVFFVGTTDDVLSYYRTARIFVLPSISEGLPLSLLEAMSCGLPVVVTSVGGNKEIVASQPGQEGTTGTNYEIGINGLVVEPRNVEALAEALLRLLEDEALSRRLGAESRKLAEKYFSQGKTVQDYLDLYERLV